MNLPQRSPAIARALAADIDGLPEDFAARVAAAARARAATRSIAWNAVVLLGAFVAMVGVCVGGWLQFGQLAAGGVEWLDPLVRAVATQPWLVVGVAGIGIVQLLTYGQRART